MRHTVPLATAAAVLTIGVGAAVGYQLVDDDSPAEAVSTTPPGSWRPADDVLVVPAKEAGETEGTALPKNRVGPHVPLPAHWFEVVEVPGTDEAATVVADRGPALLACTTWSGTSGCTVSVGHLEADRFVYDLGLGSDDFQAPGAPMEVFLLPHYTDAGEETLVVAGGSSRVESAILVLDDGTEVPATVTSDVGAASGSVYFASTRGDVERVVTYGRDGQVIEDHPLRPCGVDDNCEVR